MSTLQRAPRRVGRHPLFERGVRLGYSARGLLYSIVAVTALSVAFGNGGETTDSNGALRQLEQHAYGTVLLTGVAIGLGTYALWRALQALAAGDESDSRLRATWMRLYYGARALLYGTLCWSAVSLLLGSDGGGGEQRETLTGRALQLPAGRYLVTAAGAGILAYAAWQGYRAVTRRFERELEMTRMDDEVRRVVVPAGVAGYLARMIVFGLVGYFFVRAGIVGDAGEVIGLDGALSSLVTTTYGTWLLAGAAVGLLGFAVYSFAEGRYRRIEVGGS